MLAEGWHVSGAIRSSGKKIELPQGVQTVETGSIGPNTEWSAAIKGIDTVVHLAARVHVMDDKASDPLTDYRSVNVDGTKRLLQFVELEKVRRFIYISSVKVNGEGRPTAYTEEDPPDPQDPYGISKLEAEQILHAVADKTGLQVVIFRPPLVYGPEVKANFLQMLKVIDRGIPLPFGAIKNRRSFLFLGNLIDAIVTGIYHPAAVGKTFLISDGHDISTSDLMRMIASTLGKRPRLFSFPPLLIRLLARLTGKSDMTGRLLDSLMVDISKIKKELDWKPPFTMEEGMSETIQWYLNKHRKNNPS
jgi:nucleoside-diphosphate-sugar epimerase